MEKAVRHGKEHKEFKKWLCSCFVSKKWGHGRNRADLEERFQSIPLERSGSMLSSSG